MSEKRKNVYTRERSNDVWLCNFSLRYFMLSKIRYPPTRVRIAHEKLTDLNTSTCRKVRKNTFFPFRMGYIHVCWSKQIQNERFFVYIIVQRESPFAVSFDDFHVHNNIVWFIGDFYLHCWSRFAMCDFVDAVDLCWVLECVSRGTSTIQICRRNALRNSMMHWRCWPLLVRNKYVEF